MSIPNKMINGKHTFTEMKAGFYSREVDFTLLNR